MELQSLAFYIKNPHFYIQITIALIALSLSCIANNKIKWLINDLLAEKRQKMLVAGRITEEKLAATIASPKDDKWMRLYDLPLIVSPILFLFILVTFDAILSQFIEFSYKIVPAVAKITMAWLTIKIVYLISRNPTTNRILSFIAYPIVILSILGLLAPVITYLDSLALNFGETRISLLIVIRALLVFGLIVWVTSIVARRGKFYIRSMQNLDRNTRDLASKLFEVTLYIIMFFVSLNMMGIDLTALAVIGGAIGLGLGFGLQKIAANFISGVIMFFERWVREGDIVQIGNSSGEIKKMGIRYTLLDMWDGNEMMVPNEEFITLRIINSTSSNRRVRLELKVSVDRDQDLSKIHKLLMNVATQNIYCSKTTAPECYLEEFTDFGARFSILFWYDDASLGARLPRSELLLSIWKEFQINNIKFAQNSVIYRTE